MQTATARTEPTLADRIAAQRHDPGGPYPYAYGALAGAARRLLDAVDASPVPVGVAVQAEALREALAEIGEGLAR